MGNNIESYYSNGKLLLTGEYLVLQGAKALALPLNLGQKLEICKNDSNTLDWITFEKSTPIFTASLSLPQLKIIETNNYTKAQYIVSLLLASKALNKRFLSGAKGIAVKSTLDFNINWGLGSSSTLINNVSQWAKVDAFKLNKLISKGSGYDIACAQKNQAIIYQYVNSLPQIIDVAFTPPFLDKLNLLYLNKKIATESNILSFINQDNSNKVFIKKINSITDKVLNCDSFSLFQQLLKEHESLISNIIKKKTVKEKLFSDFNGEIKSLGAWGGDFALVASPLPVNEQQAYFTAKGFHTFFPLINLLTAYNE